MSMDAETQETYDALEVLAEAVEDGVAYYPVLLRALAKALDLDAFNGVRGAREALADAYYDALPPGWQRRSQPVRDQGGVDCNGYAVREAPECPECRGFGVTLTVYDGKQPCPACTQQKAAGGPESKSLPDAGGAP